MCVLWAAHAGCLSLLLPSKHLQVELTTLPHIHDLVMGLSRSSWWLAMDMMLWKVFSSLDGSADPMAQLSDGQVFLHISGATQDQPLSTVVWSGEFFAQPLIA